MKLQSAGISKQDFLKGMARKAIDEPEKAEQIRADMSALTRVQGDDMVAIRARESDRFESHSEPAKRLARYQRESLMKTMVITGVVGGIAGLLTAGFIPHESVYLGAAAVAGGAVGLPIAVGLGVGIKREHHQQQAEQAFKVLDIIDDYPELLKTPDAE